MWRMSVALTLIFRIEPNRLLLLRLVPKLPEDGESGIPKSMRWSDAPVNEVRTVLISGSTAPGDDDELNWEKDKHGDLVQRHNKTAFKEGEEEMSKEKLCHWWRSGGIFVVATLIKQKCLASECHLAPGQLQRVRSTNRCPPRYNNKPTDYSQSSTLRELLNNCCQCLFGKTKLISRVWRLKKQ